MDPNATLADARMWYEAGNFEAAAHAYAELDNWLTRGGFKPSEWLWA